MAKLIYGVGVNDGRYPAKVKGKNLKVYDTWRHFLERCYCPERQRKNPTYIGCQSSENFKSYSYFYEWCQNQAGFDQEDSQLDKDFLIKGNKLYSEDTCLFLPRRLNTLLLSCRSARGKLPVGVSAHQGKFLARCCTDKSSTHIGVFNTPEEAHNAYKQTKEAFIKRQAEKWKNFLDPRAFAALMAYEVSITD